MKTISVARINLNNPVLTSYIKTIRTWEHGEDFKVVNEPFYGVFLDDRFLAVSTMHYDEKKSDVQICMINGSNQNYDRIQEESTRELTNIALKQYNAKTVSIKQVKKLGTR